MRVLPIVTSIALGSCSASPPQTPPAGATRADLIGVPVNGFPSYDERLQFVAQNRARSDPNNVPAGTAAACSTVLSVQPPLDYDYDIAQAARFHSRFLLLNDCPLDHYSYCTLRADIDATACDGSAACACNGGECWPSPACDSADNGCGNSPGSRMSLFGYSGGTWGENGAAGYANSWDGVGGWVTECPPPLDPTEGHRLNVMSSSFNVLGTGSMQAPGGCWSGFYFSDYGYISSRPIPRIPSGVHRPESGSNSTTFGFYANWYDAGGDPQSIDVVIDGVCQPLAIEIGTDVGNRTYLHQSTLADGCHEYYVLARDAAGVRVTYPEVGSLTVEVGGATCTAEYIDTQMAASCEAASDGGAVDLTAPDVGSAIDSGIPDGPAAADLGGGSDSGSSMDSGGVVDAGLPPDADPPDAAHLDGAPSTDTMSEAATFPDPPPTPDQGTITFADAESPSDGAIGESDGGDVEISAGCSCAVGSSGQTDADGFWLAVLVLAGLLGVSTAGGGRGPATRSESDPAR